jgi:hypothetical protein
MFDTSQDARGLVGHLGLTGCVAAGRYLFAGATTLDGSVPSPVATPLSADEAQAVLAAGLALLLVDNGVGYGDTTGPNAYASGQRKAQQAVAQAQAVGAPSGCLIACDLETWAVDPDFMRGYGDAIAASPYKLMWYGSADAAWRPSWEQASAQWPSTAVLCWTARYVGPWTGTAPGWDPQDDGGDMTVAWQFTSDGPQNTDLSLLRLPLPDGYGGFWLPDGAAGSPTTQTAFNPDLQAVIQFLDQAVAANQQQATLLAQAQARLSKVAG